jgi:hypothetical protein
LNSIKSITQNLSDMNKFLDDISEYKIVDKLKEKLQESENLKMEIEAILIKRVFIDVYLNKALKSPTTIH